MVVGLAARARVHRHDAALASLSDDPNHKPSYRAVVEWLPTARRVHVDTDVMGLVEREITGRSVLDIGVIEHSANYFEKPTWRHGRIAKQARRCLGVDILEPLVEEVRKRGYDVRCVDATSGADLGERFEVVFIGDVIDPVLSQVPPTVPAARDGDREPRPHLVDHPDDGDGAGAAQPSGADR